MFGVRRDHGGSVLLEKTPKSCKLFVTGREKERSIGFVFCFPLVMRDGGNGVL